jgi:hypothetical protein
LVGLVAGAAALTAAWLLGAFGGNGDDDRPPIIVNNGSIEIRALPMLGDPGSWTPVDTKYRHTHTNNGPSSLTVHVAGATEPQCGNRKFPNATRIAFALNGVAQGFEIILENDSVTVMPGSHQVTRKGALLTLDVGTATLQTATVFFGGGGNQACTFQNDEGAVLIEQR